MITIKNERGTIEMYDEPDDMPQDIWHLFNKFLMQDSGIGSTIQDFDKHLFKLDNYLKAKKFAESIQERKNLHLSVFNNLMGINFESLSFACLIKSIDGKDVKIENDDDAEIVSKQANKIVSHKEVQNYVLNVKKKLAIFLGYTIQTDIQPMIH